MIFCSRSTQNPGPTIRQELSARRPLSLRNRMKTVCRFDDRNSSMKFRLMLKTDEISGTIRRVDTTNSDYFSSSAPATAYPPRATRSATSPLPPPPSVPLSRPRARTDNAPLSDIQADPRARDFSNQGNRSIDRSFVPRPLLGPVDSFRLSQSNKAGGRMEIRTLGKPITLSY